MRTHNDVFVSQLLILARQHSDDVMRGTLLLFRLTIGKVLKVCCLFLSLDDGLELQTAQLADDKLRGEGIAHSSRESSAKLLRRQIFHRLLHHILLLRHYGAKYKI